MRIKVADAGSVDRESSALLFGRVVVTCASTNSSLAVVLVKALVVVDAIVVTTDATVVGGGVDVDVDVVIPSISGGRAISSIWTPSLENHGDEVGSARKWSRSIIATFLLPTSVGCVPSPWKSAHSHTRPSDRGIAPSAQI